MMTRRLHIVLMLVTIAAIACTAVASGAGSGAAGYTVRPAADANLDLPFCGLAVTDSPLLAITYEQFIVTMMIGDIGIGERKHYVKNVDGDITTLNPHLIWQNPGVSLKLLVISPGGTQFGPWEDGIDGRIDHEINMDISNPGGIEEGQWHYYVIYGQGVERTEFSI